MMRWMFVAVMSLWLVAPVLAGNLNARAVNDAARPEKPPAADTISAPI